jgi:hypothetical protein
MCDAGAAIIRLFGSAHAVFWNCAELLRCLLDVVAPDHADVKMEWPGLHRRMFALSPQRGALATDVDTAEDRRSHAAMAAALPRDQLAHPKSCFLF